MTDPFHIQVIERLTRIEAEAKGAHEHAKKTNGRVTKLETNQSKIILALVLAFGLILGLGVQNAKDIIAIFV